MPRTLALCLSLLLLACVPVSPMNKGPHHVRPLHVRTSCGLTRDSVVCAEQRVLLVDLGIAMPLRNAARRHLGGLWLVDAEHVLHRLDARAMVTGRYERAVEQVFMTDNLVCAHESSGSLWCAVDRHDDRGCTAGDALTDFVAVAHLDGPLLQPAPKMFCDTQARCVTLTRRCQTGCLRFPSCHSALRCVDACPAGQPELLAQPVAPARVFSPGRFIIEPASSDS